MTLRNRPRVGTGSPKVLFGESKAASRSLISSAVRGAVYSSTSSPSVLLEGGVRIFVTGYSNDNVYQYDMTTAGDISTATFTQSFAIGGQELTPTEIMFKPDGLKMFITGVSGDEVDEYALTSPYDISTASYTTSFDPTAQAGGPIGLSFNDDGSIMYIMDNTSDSIYAYNLSTEWDVSTAVYSSKSFSVFAYDVSPSGVAFNNDGSKMYFSGTGSGRVFEATLSTPFDITTASVIESTFVSTVRSFCFNEDGTRMYGVNNTTDDLREWSLSTPFDITTLSLVNTLDLSSQDSNPFGVFLSRTVYE